MFSSYNGVLPSTIGFYPYLTVNNVNPLTPYLNSANLNNNSGPFSSVAVTVRDADVCNVRFLNTMNDLTSAGKLISSVFY